MFGLSNYWQQCRRKEFVGQQQKRQWHYHSDRDGELIYKHSKRYYYLSLHVLTSVTMALSLINAASFLYGYPLTADELIDEQAKYVFMYLTMTFSPMLYLLTNNIVSRTIFYIYYNESERHFRGICYNWHMARKNVMFKPGEVQLMSEHAGVKQLLFGGYIIHKKSYHMSAMDFTSTRYYNMMLGFIN